MQSVLVKKRNNIYAYFTYFKLLLEYDVIWALK